jgi:hypothetical protein
MKGWLAALGIVLGLVVLVVGYLWLSFHNVQVRYRLTVEVQDGDQIKTGSSVIEASYTIQPDYLWAGPDTYARIKGYAPTVDLGEKGMLFLTFVNAERTPGSMQERNKQLFCPADDTWCLPFAAYDKPGTVMDISGTSKRKVALAELLRRSGPRDVPFISLPKLARFMDVNDRHKLVPVEPDNLAASFGPGVQLKRVILQLADDPITPPPPIWPQWLKGSGETYVGILSGVSK